HHALSADWQVTRQLQNISMEQDSERNRFSQEAQAWEQSLEQRQQELARVQEELQQAWQEGNSSQQELARWEAKLLRVMGALNVTQKELQDVQGKLIAIKQAVSSLHVCLNADCCPSGWLLYRGKCLFISEVKKNWWDSYWDCKDKSSLLLVNRGWESWILPHFLQADGAKYWIGKENTYRLACAGTPGWVKAVDAIPVSLTRVLSPRYNRAYCPLLVAGKMQNSLCKKSYPWICEQPPLLSSVSESLNPPLAED
ncbi:hypothetical protein ASZ78_012351, partial [Callipepla squamata]